MIISPLDKWITDKTGAGDAASLEEYQMSRIRETVEYAKQNSRFYREHLAGFSADNITDSRFMSQLPFTTPDDVIKSPLDFVCVSPGDIDRIVSLPTSGTTGPSKRIYFTRDDQELTIDFFHHGMSTFVGSSDRVMIFLPGESDGGVSDLLRRGLLRLNCESLVYGPIYDYEDAYQALKSSNCTCAIGLPSQLFALSRIGEPISLKSVLLCSDYISDAVKSALSATWGCDVYSHYGMIETGLGGGVDCCAHEGYHLRESDLYYEIIDPVSGLPVDDGNSGELVFTTLTRSGMPLIRYKTDDISRLVASRCSCGSFIRRLDHVYNRKSYSIDIGGGVSLFMAAFDDALYCIPSLIGFSAEIVTDALDTVLKIGIFTKDDKFDMNYAHDMVKSICKLKSAFSEGRLRLDLFLSDENALATGNTKRYINYTRI